MNLAIRRYRPSDHSGVYLVCLRTGDSGRDATGQFQDPDLLGDVYAGPYLRLEPHFAFVLADESDEVLGYVLGAPDTMRFERQCEEAWWPALRDRYPLPYEDSRDGALISVIHHPWLADAEVLRDHPAHLHIDLLPPAQGRGYGRALMDRLLAEFETVAVTGVHLGVSNSNVGAIGFYQRLGFTTIVRHPGSLVMARTLP